ncbi:MAG: hypothetical protein WEF86_04430 [Gemmatimonadota bacterium]
MRRIAFLLAILPAACEGTSPVDPTTATIRVVSGHIGVDTIDAHLPDLIVAIVDAGGKPMPAVEVEFEAVDEGPQVHFTHPVGAPSSDFSALSDGRGRVRAGIKLGDRVGSAKLIVRVPSSGHQVTVGYYVLAGALAAIRFTPSDTALYVGADVHISAVATDRSGNDRPEPVTLSTPDGSPIALIGNTARGVAFGRAQINGRVEEVRGEAAISVVPDGVIALRNVHYNGDGGIMIMNMDGSGVLNLEPRVTPRVALLRDLEWDATGGHLMFYDEEAVGAELWKVDLHNQFAPLFTVPPALGSLRAARPSQDGEWVYFTSLDLRSGAKLMWRARRDGSQPTRLTPGGDAPNFQNDEHPFPSPDGRYIVFATDRAPFLLGGPFKLLRLDLATSEMRELNVRGTHPRWSPTGEWIAYHRDYRIWLVRPDGSGERLVGPSQYQERFAWSPDGKWIAASREGGPVIDLVEVETGLVLPLNFTGFYDEPAWRPAVPVE